MVAAGVGLVSCVVALVVSALDRGLPIGWQEVACSLLLVGALGWMIGAILSSDRRLFYGVLATGLLLPPAIWLWTRRAGGRHRIGR